MHMLEIWANLRFFKDQITFIAEFDFVVTNAGFKKSDKRGFLQFYNFWF